jgi:hypothetical protein
MNSESSNNFTGIFILFIAIIVILFGEYVIFAINSFIGDFIIILGIVIAVFGIFALLGEQMKESD